MEKTLFQIIIKAIAAHKVELSKGNTEFLGLILFPLKFHKSTPSKIGVPSEKNHGETKYQREIYDRESELWYDMELPIGQWENRSSKRVDLIGFDKSDKKYIICELKKTEEAGQPFDALLQLISYYLMIKQNCKMLDEKGIFHTNGRKKFSWEDVANGCKLQIRATKSYWDNWEKDTDKNKAAKEIICQCKDLGLIIEIKKDENYHP